MATSEELAETGPVQWPAIIAGAIGAAGISFTCMLSPRELESFHLFHYSNMA